MADPSLPELIGQFCSAADVLWKSHHVFRLTAASVKKDRDSGIAATGDGGRLAEAQGATIAATRAVMPIGHVLAKALEQRGDDATALLTFLHTLDRAGGPEAALRLWQPLKVQLQRLALRGAPADDREAPEATINRLLAGPDDAELTPREMAIVEAYLRQPVSFATVQREKRATGESPTMAARYKLKYIRDFNRSLIAAPATAPAPTGAEHVSPKRTKRSTVNGDAKTKLIAALTAHHQYADDGCLNMEPIGVSELARRAGVAKATASAFFEAAFGGHTIYCHTCVADRAAIVASLKLLNGDYAPSVLFGKNPPGEGHCDDEDE